MHRLIKYLISTSAVLSYCSIIGLPSAHAENSNQLEVFSYWTSGSEASAAAISSAGAAPVAAASSAFWRAARIEGECERARRLGVCRGAPIF